MITFPSATKPFISNLKDFQKKTEDIKSKIWSFLTPQIITIEINAKMPSNKFMYLITKLVRCSKTSFKVAYFRTNLLELNRKTK